MRKFGIPKYEDQELFLTSALSSKVPLIFAPIGIAVQVGANSAGHTGTFLQVLLVAVLGVLAFIFIFLGLKFLLKPIKNQLVAVIFVYFLSGISRSSILGKLSIYFDLTGSFELRFRLAGGLVFTPALLLMIAYSVFQYDRHRKVVEKLKIRQAELLRIGENYEEIRDRIEREINDLVFSKLSPELTKLDEVLTQLKSETSNSAAVEELIRLVDMEVRPLSQSLTQEIDKEKLKLDQKLPIKVRVPRPQALSPSLGFRPLATSLFFMAMMFPSAIRSNSFLTVIPYELEVFLGTYLVFSFLKWILKSLIINTYLAIVFVTTLHLIVGISLIYLVYPVWVIGIQFIVGTGLAIIFLTGLLNSISAAVEYRRKATENEYRKIDSELRSHFLYARRHTVIVRKKMARLIHGQLQGVLQASAIRLASLDKPNPAMIDEVRLQILDAVNQIVKDQKTLNNNLETTIDNLSGVWGRSCTLDVEINPIVLPSLESHRDVEDSLCEVLVEAVNNAFRHGRASLAEVKVYIDRSPELGSTTVKLEVRDNGFGISQPRSTGLGTMIYEELCDSWSIQSTPKGARFEADFYLE